MLVTKTEKQVDIPHERDQWMQFRRLSWFELNEAAEVASKNQVNKIKAMGPDVFQAVASAVDAKTLTPPAPGKTEDGNGSPQGIAAFDQEQLLLSGIVAWSYEEKVSPKTIKQLDVDTATWAANEIYELSREKTEDERKNV